MRSPIVAFTCPLIASVFAQHRTPVAARIHHKAASAHCPDPVAHEIVPTPLFFLDTVIQFWLMKNKILVVVSWFKDVSLYITIK